ncbi:MAG: tetratricopeptide repeat protein [Desulfobacterales bacterium]
MAILIVYCQAIHLDFNNYDDNLYVTENQQVQAGLTVGGLYWAFTTGHASNWHPLTWLSHMLDCELYGLNPMGHHWTNIQIHLTNTLLLFFILQYMTGAIWRSGFVAALFALHPLHVESVAWVAERKDLLCAFFWMLSVWAYLRYIIKPTTVRYILLIIFFICGLMSKPMIVTLPFTLLLIDFWPLSRLTSPAHKEPASYCQTFISLVRGKIPLFALSAISSIITVIFQQHGKSIISLDFFPLSMRIANALISYLKYIEKMIWPVNLAVFYPYQKWPAVEVILSGSLLLCISALVILASRGRPYLTTGWLWYLGTLVPTVGLVQVGLQSMADRYTYIPLIGLFIIVVWGISDISSRWRRQNILFPLLSSIIFVSLMICTYFQVHHWKNSITLFTHALNVTRNNYIALCNMGQALEIQGRFDEAIPHYYKALEINPNYVDAYNNIGVALARKGDVKNAINHYYRALQINPDNAKAHNNLGAALACRGNDKDAIYHYNEALRIDSDYAGAYYNLGKIFVNQGKTKDAILHFQKALQKNPDMTQALYNLSWIVATSNDERFRNGKEAINLAEKLCKLQNYSQPLSLDALAAAYAEIGKFDRAVKVAQQGLSMALMHGPEELASGLTKRLQLYQAGIPYRQK